MQHTRVHYSRLLNFCQGCSNKDSSSPLILSLIWLDPSFDNWFYKRSLSKSYRKVKHGGGLTLFDTSLRHITHFSIPLQNLFPNLH